MSAPEAFGDRRRVTPEISGVGGLVRAHLSSNLLRRCRPPPPTRASPPLHACPGSLSSPSWWSLVALSGLDPQAWEDVAAEGGWVRGQSQLVSVRGVEGDGDRCNPCLPSRCSAHPIVCSYSPRTMCRVPTKGVRVACIINNKVDGSCAIDDRRDRRRDSLRVTSCVVVCIISPNPLGRNPSTGQTPVAEGVHAGALSV